MAATHPTTKSIDVGSMFLMDLSVQESEMIGDLQNSDNDIVFPASKTISSYPLNEKARSKTKINYASNHQQSSLVTTYNQLHTSNSKSIAYHRQENRNDYLGNSLDRLASAIQHDEVCEQQENVGAIITTSASTTKKSPTIITGNLVTTVQPLPPLDMANFNPSSTSASSSSSLSEADSFVATSSSGDSSSLSDSFGVDDDGEEDVGVNVERASANTREDSGVLDMRNLESTLNNSYDIDDLSCSNDDHQKEQTLEHKLLHQEKPISTNLINKSAHNNNNNISIRRPNQPTKINNISSHDCTSNNNNHHHYRSQTSSKRSMLMSASLPIQCPPRQMKRDLGKSKKLDLIDETIAVNSEDAQEDQFADVVAQQHDSTHCWNQMEPVDDIETDDIWEQDYNLNHKNHYPIDEYDEENLRAETNPEQLFESIKALARSLHEDAELFGSLPPKRLLESPIHRSLAFA